MVVKKLSLDSRYVKEIQDKVSLLKFDYAEQAQGNKDTVYQYIHMIPRDGNELVRPILDVAYKHLNIKWGIRIKVNKLLPQDLTDKQEESLWHKDRDESGYISLIYYVNDSDGDTEVGDYKNTPKAGEMIYFDSNVTHKPSLPTQGERTIINFIFEKNK